MSNLFIIRHARSKFNVKQTLDLDSNLTAAGFQQSYMLAKFLKKMSEKISISKIITSPFLRCLQTTQPIAESLGLKAIVDNDLHEYTLHEHLSQGLQGTEIPCRADEFKYQYLNEEKTFVFHAETNEDFHQRMLRVLSKIEDGVILVSHGLPILTMLHILKGNIGSIPLWDHSVHNASISWIKFHSNGMRQINWWGREIYEVSEI